MRGRWAASGAEGKEPAGPPPPGRLARKVWGQEPGRLHGAPRKAPRRRGAATGKPQLGAETCGFPQSPPPLRAARGCPGPSEPRCVRRGPARAQPPPGGGKGRALPPPPPPGPGRPLAGGAGSGGERGGGAPATAAASSAGAGRSVAGWVRASRRTQWALSRGEVSGGDSHRRFRIRVTRRRGPELLKTLCLSADGSPDTGIGAGDNTRCGHLRAVISFSPRSLACAPFQCERGGWPSERLLFGSSVGSALPGFGGWKLCAWESPPPPPPPILLQESRELSL